MDTDAFQQALNTTLRERNWTLSQMGRAAGIQPSILSRWLSSPAGGGSVSRPSPRNLQKLAPVLGLSYEDLMRMCGYLPGPPTEPDPLDAYLSETTSEMREVLRGVDRMWWATIVKAFSRGVDHGRDVAAAINNQQSQQHPVKSAPPHRIKSAQSPFNSTPSPGDTRLTEN